MPIRDNLHAMLIQSMVELPPQTRGYLCLSSKLWKEEQQEKFKNPAIIKAYEEYRKALDKIYEQKRIP